MLIVEELFLYVLFLSEFGEDVKQKLMGLIVDFVLLLLFEDGLVDSKVTVEGTD